MGNCHSPRNQVRSPGQSYTYMLIKIGLWRIIPRDFRQFSIYCVTHAVDGSYPETSDSSQYTVLLTQLTDHTQRLQTVLNMLCYSRSWRIIPRDFRQFSIYCVIHAVDGSYPETSDSSQYIVLLTQLTDHTQRLQTVLNILCYSRSWRIIPRDFRQFSIYCVTHAVDGSYPETSDSSQYIVLLTQLTDHTQSLQTVLNILCYSRSGWPEKTEAPIVRKFRVHWWSLCWCFSNCTS